MSLEYETASHLRREVDEENARDEVHPLRIPDLHRWGNENS